MLFSCTGVQRSSLAIIARARRGEPGDEAKYFKLHGGSK